MEYIGFYNEYREGLLRTVNERTMTMKQSQDYVKLYCEYKGLSQNKKKKKEAEQLRETMKEIESKYAYDKIIPARNFGMKILLKEETEAKELEEIRKKALEH